MSWEGATPAPKGRQRHHAWYKERLNLKFLKTYNPSSTLDGERWTFVANNMDDFRTSLPAQIDGSKMVVKNKVNRVPLVNSTSCVDRQVSLQSCVRGPGHNPARLTLYSKIGPRRQLKEKTLGMAEAELLKHPLGLFPHLSDSIPQEVREDVVSLLDPELNLALNTVESTTSAEDAKAVVVDTIEAEPCCDDRPNIYRWPLVKTVEELCKEQSILASQKVISPTQESRVNEVTHELVQWAIELGGDEEIHIDEGVVKSLFTSDYETKPFLSVPLRVVDLTSVPMELVSHNQRSTSSPNHSSNKRAAFMFHDTAGSTDIPHLVRTRYGAWYLPVSHWKRKLRNGQLTRPQSDDHIKHDQPAASTLKDETLRNLHGAKAFKDFLVAKPGAIMPKFLIEGDPKLQQKHSVTV